MMTQNELLERLNDSEVKAIVAKYVGDDKPEQQSLPGFEEDDETRV